LTHIANIQYTYLFSYYLVRSCQGLFNLKTSFNKQYVILGPWLVSTPATRGLQILVRVWSGQLIARGEFLCPLLPACGR